MNGIAQITLAGNPIQLKFGMPAIRRIAEKMTQYELVTWDQYNELGIAHILYAGYVNSCAMRDQPPSLSFEQVYSYVEDAEGDDVVQEIVAAIRAFEDSRYVKGVFEKKKAEMENQSSLTGTA